LGAGKPFQGETHSVLRSATGHNRVLDWLLRATASVNPEVTFIAGYQKDQIAAQFPQLSYIGSPDWENSGAAASLLCADLTKPQDYLVSYADVLFRESAVKSLMSASGDVAILVDSHWRRRFENRSQTDLERCEKVNLHQGKVTRLGRDIDAELADAEFAGLVRLTPKAAQFLAEHNHFIPEAIRSGNLPQLLEYMRIRGFTLSAVDVEGDWAELNVPEDLTHFILGTKAQTLHRLQRLVKKSRIEDQISFTVAQWQDSAEAILADVAHSFGGKKLVVRSSALSEDGFTSANAGAYDSVLNVDGADPAAVTAAIVQVVNSYPDANPANQVLVQPMVQGVVASGVAFTRTLAQGAPYYVINYDDVTRSTESITSGSSAEHKTALVYRGEAPKLDALAVPLRGLMPALLEIEQLLDFDSLDIEFAISESGQVHILQVRPIAVQHDVYDASAVSAAIAAAREQFQQSQESGPFVVGSRAMFGVMPDWNPAEIIGTRPGALATSLYRYLIMDDVWATQRAEYGYRDVRPQPLLHEFAGHPYVDIRASFNSLVPAQLDDELAGRLVDFYQAWLEQHPQLHDKVEFDVVPTCYSLNFDHWRQRLLTEGGFSDDDIAQLEQGLRQVTQHALARTDGDWIAVRQLEQRFEKISSTTTPPLQRAWLLLEEAHRHGTLVFAHLARSAFVAMTLLRSAKSEGVLSEEAYNAFMESIETVSHRFASDAASVAGGSKSWESFVADYGHLRPGTYDIMSKSYAEDPEHYLAPAVEQARLHPATSEAASPTAWLAEQSKMVVALAEHGINTTASALDAFLRQAIEGREYAKFVFTRHLSAALDALVAYGAEHDIDRDQLALIPLSVFRILANQPEAYDAQRWLQAAAEEGRASVAVAQRVELPSLLCQSLDFTQFEYSSNQPNFVGSGKVVADCVDLEQFKGDESLELEGKIALIPQADPGYDWLFGRGIAGLITLYGGANSHMAIRAAEFGLPAAIGVGESRYASWSRAQVLELDAGNHRVQVIR
jgi:choline kinase